MARKEMPEYIKLWLEKIYPRCCHTCGSYDDEGICTVYKAEPPEDFVGKLDACSEWTDEDGIPF